MHIGSRTVFQSGTAITVLSHLEVDADGSPRAYAPRGSGLQGLDYLANAGHPGNWWALALINGRTPYIQSPEDPAPGYYVSTTSLTNAQYDYLDPRHYVNSEEIPFAVIPAAPKFGISLGDVGFAFNLSSGDSSQFVVADIGPHNQIGEASIACARNLAINSDPKKGGTDKLIVLYVFFQNSTIVWPESPLSVLGEASARLHAFGGLDKLKSSFPQYDWSKF